MPWLLTLGFLLATGFPSVANAGPKLFDRPRLSDWLGPVPGDDAVLSPEIELDSQNHATVTFRDVGDGCRLLVFPAEEAKAGDARAKVVALRGEGGAVPSCDARLRSAIARIQAHVLPTEAEHRSSGGGGARGGGASVEATSTMELILTAIAALLLSLLPWTLFESLRGSDRRVLWWFLGAVAVAFLIRALAPHRLVMVYFGYEHIGEAADLAALPRYGPGATLLWWLLFRVTSPDHAAVQWLHAALGSLTVGLWVAYVYRGTRSHLGALFTALLLALTPLFVRDHVSESMAVPAMFAFSMAALLLAEVARLVRAHEGAGLPAGAPRRIVAATVALLYAASCRPDLAVAMPLFALAFAVAFQPWATVGRALLRAWPYLLGALLLATPLILVSASRADADVTRGNLPRLGLLGENLTNWLMAENVVFRWWDFPVGVWAAVLLGPFFASAGRRGLWLAVAALVAVIPTFLDFNEVSILRLHVPSATLVVVAAGLGVAAMASRGLLGKILGFLCLAGALGSAYPSAEPLLRARNPDQEDALARESASRLRGAKKAIVYRIGYGDLGIPDVHLHFPDYLFQNVGVEAQNLRKLLDAPPAEDGAERFFLRSFRCHLWPGWKKGPRDEHPICKRMCERFDCQPLLERDAPNLHDWKTFDGYGESPTLKVGLYRLVPR